MTRLTALLSLPVLVGLGSVQLAETRPAKKEKEMAKRWTHKGCVITQGGPYWYLVRRGGVLVGQALSGRGAEQIAEDCAPGLAPATGRETQHQKDS